jgi:hypothetical protein
MSAAVTGASSGLTAGVESAVPADSDFTERDALWFAFGVGDVARVAARVVGAGSAGAAAGAAGASGAAGSVVEVVSPGSVEAAAGRGGTGLPLGTVDLLEELPFPHGRIAAGATADPLGHALVTAFAVLRREPANPFNDHRGYPSARSKFPVQLFLTDQNRQRWLDTTGHRLTDLPPAPRPDPTRPDPWSADPGSPDPGSPGTRLILTGRYTRFPDYYQWYRGALVNIEVGINLRSLAIALHLFAIPATLHLPAADSADILTDLGLNPTWQWSLPLSLHLHPDTPPTTGTAQPPTPPPPPNPAAHATATTGPDPILAEVLAINRTQNYTDPPAPLGPAIPNTQPNPPDPPSQPGLSWAQLLYQRSSGRVPRGLFGMNGRLRPLPATALTDAAAWAAIPPPGPTLTTIHHNITLTAVTQSITDHPDGIYTIHHNTITLQTAGEGFAARLQENYGYPLSPIVACDIRHASILWFLSVRPRDLITEHGPGAWNAAHYTCGWIAQGLCLTAASHDLYARPVRAFDEPSTQTILGLPPENMIVLAVITSAARNSSGVQLDLRL